MWLYSRRVPISAADCLAGTELTEPALSPDGRFLAFVRAHGNEARLVVVDLADRTSVQSSPFLVQAGRGLGGGCFDWMPTAHALVALSVDADIRLWTPGVSDDVVASAPIDRVGDRPRRISSPTVDAQGTSIAYVVDQAEIHVLDLVTRHTRRVDRGDFDFVIDPAWWGAHLVWQAWSVPHMPWDESCLVSTEGVVAARADVQYQQPRASASGRHRGWLDDSDGWLNLVIDGVRRVQEMHEHAGPTWGDGQRSWCFDDSGREAAFVRNEDGFGRLCSVDVATGIITERAKAIHGQLTWRGSTLAAIRTGARTPTQIVLYDTSGETWTRSTVAVGPAHDWQDHPALVEPDIVHVANASTAGIDLVARLYRSPRSRGRLLCWVHGGPTDQWQVTFMARFVYWLDRGYDILVPDFRGSTGHGRAFTQALHHGWGETDVEDVATILAEVQSRFAYRPEATAVLGSSAGGLTALRVVAATPSRAACGVVAYPVCDISALDSTTHRFEAHYNRSLVGSPAETVERSRRRSPQAHVDSLARVPLLVFHGTDDPVVPIDQSSRLVTAVKGTGGHVDFVVFEGEGHGFRRLENKIEEFERTEEFLERNLDH